MNCSWKYRDHHTLFQTISKHHGVSTPRLLGVSYDAITLSISRIVVSLLSLDGNSGDISLLRFVIFICFITTFTWVFARFSLSHMQYKPITKRFPKARGLVIWQSSAPHHDRTRVTSRTIQSHCTASCSARRRSRQRAIICALSRAHEMYQQDYPVTLYSLFLMAIIKYRGIYFYVVLFSRQIMRS